MKLDEGSLLSLGLTPEQASAVLEAREEEKKARACEEEKSACTGRCCSGRAWTSAGWMP